MADRPEYQSALFQRGIAVRREVLGAAYVDESLARATRGILNIGMLMALNRGAEPRLHPRAALTNGVSRDEIKEVLLQSGVYRGIPAALETEVFQQVDRGPTGSN